MSFSFFSPTYLDLGLWGQQLQGGAQKTLFLATSGGGAAATESWAGHEASWWDMSPLKGGVSHFHDV